MKAVPETLRDFDTALRIVQSPLTLPLNLSDDNDETVWLRYEQTVCIVAAHWVVRNRLGLWSKREHPFSTSLFRSLEPWGRYLTELLALCIACDDESPSRSSYSNGFQHWTFCVQSLRFSALDQILNSRHESSRDYIRAMRQALRALKRFQNPYNGERNESLKALFAIAIPQAEKTFKTQAGFCDHFYAPCLEAQRKFIESLDGAGLLVLAQKTEGTSLRVKKGRGKVLIKVQTEEFPKLNFVTLVP